MNRSTKRVLFSILALIVLLAACTPAAPAPTQDPAIIQNQINQAVELTVAAQNAQATQDQAAVVPSNTPLPTQTEASSASPTPELPTATPFVIIPPTNTAVVSSGSGGSVPVIKPDYSCNAINRKPYDDTYYAPNKHIDIKWTIVNTGTKTIRAGTDVKFYSGTQMATVNRVEIPNALAPGDTYVVDLDATAPSKQGHYVMTWVVEGQLCFPYLSIYVEK